MELKEEGTLDAIKKNWTGSDEELGKTPYESPADVDTSAGTLTMATNAEFPPYESREETRLSALMRTSHRRLQISWVWNLRLMIWHLIPLFRQLLPARQISALPVLQ